MKKTLVILLLFVNLSSFGQETNAIWDKNEVSQYSKLVELAKYVSKKELSEISKDTLYKKYIFFEHYMKDTVYERKNRRIMLFDTVFYHFKKTIDSIGVDNLDAKPVRFYKKHKIYEPFERETAKQSISGEKMYTQDTNVFAYYKKDEPENPLGVLLFEPLTNKLVSWILIDQGGYKYFLIFNMI